MATATHAEIEISTYASGATDIWFWLWDGPPSTHREIVHGHILRNLKVYQDLDIWYPDEVKKARGLLDALGHSNIELKEIRSR